MTEQDIINEIGGDKQQLINYYAVMIAEDACNSPSDVEIAKVETILQRYCKSLISEVVAC